MGTYLGPEIEDWPLPLSVVIPALNAAGTLSAALAYLGPVGECIVVDGGSVDGTPALAEHLGARVVRAARGRGGQIAAGVEQARFPWIFVLHADTRMQRGWRAAAAAHMAS